MNAGLSNAFGNTNELSINNLDNPLTAYLKITRSIPQKKEIWLKPITSGLKYTSLHVTINVCGLETLALTASGQEDITEVTDPNPVNSILSYNYPSWYELDASNPSAVALCSEVTQFWLASCTDST